MISKDGRKRYMILSFIVPIYNAPEDKIERCFNSILRIESIDYECIIIDDGSKDYVKNLCGKYVEKNKQFRYFYQENKGVSAARNYGINNAKGEYVAFVDADDEICPNIVSEIIESDNKADIIISDLLMVNNQQEEVWNAFDSKIIEYDIVIERLMRDRTLNGPYCKYIRASLLQDTDTKFNVALYSGEDGYFFKTILLHKPSIEYIPKISYIYYKDVSSARARAIKYGTLFFGNAKACFEMDVKCILYGDFPKEKKEILLNECKEKYIINLFLGGASDPIIYHIFNKKYKIELVKAIAQFRQDEIKKMNYKVRFFYYVVKYKVWCLIYLYSYIRKIHLREKGFI